MSHQIKTTIYSNMQFAQMVMNSMPAGLCTCRIAEKVKLTYFNDSAYEILGYSKKEFQHIAEDGMSIVYPPDEEQLKKWILQSMTSGKMFEHAFRVLHKDGTYRRIHVNGTKEEGAALLTANLVFVDTTLDENKDIVPEEFTSQMMYRAKYDATTGIYNKETFLSEAEELLKKNSMTEYVMACLEIDRFKELSGFLGKEEGNRILKKVALRLEKKSNKESLCGRVEGEEFVFLMPKSRIDFTNLVTSRVMMDENRSLDYQVEFSYGIYLIEDNQENPQEMLDKAEIALRTIKGSMNKKYAFFDASLYDAQMRTQVLISSLKEAMKKKQMEIYYQPIYRLNSNEMVSAEALIRWYHPEKGVIAPYNYIQLCEQNGYIAEIDHYVLDQVCQMLMERQQKGLKVVPIHINFSRINFYIPDISEKILAVTKLYGVSPSLIRLEITEDGYTENPKQIILAFDRLKRMGFDVIMDDFGKGISSLNMLVDISVNTLKVDVKLLNAKPNVEKDQNMVMNVIRMAKDLNMKVIAERVETEEQLKYLQGIGCDDAQGYLFSRPIPGEEFDGLLNIE